MDAHRHSTSRHHGFSTYDASRHSSRAGVNKSRSHHHTPQPAFSYGSPSPLTPDGLFRSFLGKLSPSPTKSSWSFFDDSPTRPKSPLRRAAFPDGESFSEKIPGAWRSWQEGVPPLYDPHRFPTPPPDWSPKVDDSSNSPQEPSTPKRTTAEPSISSSSGFFSCRSTPSRGTTPEYEPDVMSVTVGGRTTQIKMSEPEYQAIADILKDRRETRRRRKHTSKRERQRRAKEQEDKDRLAQERAAEAEKRRVQAEQEKDLAERVRIQRLHQQRIREEQEKRAEDARRAEEEAQRRVAEEAERVREENRRREEAEAARRLEAEVARIATTFANYKVSWTYLEGKNALSANEIESVTFSMFPWPSLSTVFSPNDLTLESVRAFILHQNNLEHAGKTTKERVRAELLRWHPDKFTFRLTRVRADTETLAMITEGAGLVTRWLNRINEE